VLDPGVLRFVLESLPPPPARVLEVGAGDGELARALDEAGYEVMAIDPAAAAEGPVRAVALHELDEAPFDAAVAVVSMHHVRPLHDSCERLAELIGTGGSLVLDEFDVDRVDQGAAEWVLAHVEGHQDRQPSEVIADLRHHCHPLSELRAALEPWFELSETVRGAYLYRFAEDLELREVEERLMADGSLPVTGARVVGTRR
jgi:SAM-dependent methyltransferase